MIDVIYLAVKLVLNIQCVIPHRADCLIYIAIGCALACTFQTINDLAAGAACTIAIERFCLIDWCGWSSRVRDTATRHEKCVSIYPALKLIATALTTRYSCVERVSTCISVHRLQLIPLLFTPRTVELHAE